MAKPTADIFTLADYATISQDQKLSIIGMFDQFFVQNLPSVWPKMYLVAVLKGEPNEELELTLKLVKPKEDEQNFPDRDFKIKFGPNGRANVVTELVNFPLTQPGVHKIQLRHTNEIVGSLEYNVTKTTPTYEKPAN